MNNVHDQWLNKCENIELYDLSLVVGMVLLKACHLKLRKD
jgi:hypothetical protein